MYTETHLEKTCQGYEWLNFYDRLQTAIWSDQLGECVQYMPYCAQGFHELFGQEKSEGGRVLERKRDSWEVIRHPLQPPLQPFSRHLYLASRFVGCRMCLLFRHLRRRNRIVRLLILGWELWMVG